MSQKPVASRFRLEPQRLVMGELAFVGILAFVECRHGLVVLVPEGCVIFLSVQSLQRNGEAPLPANGADRAPVQAPDSGSESSPTHWIVSQGCFR